MVRMFRCSPRTGAALALFVLTAFVLCMPALHHALQQDTPGSAAVATTGPPYGTTPSADMASPASAASAETGSHEGHDAPHGPDSVCTHAQHLLDLPAQIAGLLGLWGLLALVAVGTFALISTSVRARWRAWTRRRRPPMAGVPLFTALCVFRI